MINFNFKDYSEFKELFGIINHGNGVKSRKNLILLQCIKNKAFRHYVSEAHEYYWQSLKSIDVLMTFGKQIIYEVGCQLLNKNYVSLLNGSFVVFSNTMKLDENNGICMDGDCRSIRYVLIKTGKVYKMKAGKFLRRVINECGASEILPEQLVTYLCEKFAERWEACNPIKDSYNLVVSTASEDFEKIYNSDYLVGDFGSCMVDKDFASFYYNELQCCRAAYLENSDGLIVARCVIYECKDLQNNDYRLAERQYSSDSNLVLQRLLINKLIGGGYIDGYKEVGASCHDSRNFVANDGSSLRNKTFEIPANLNAGSVISYQDSFKYYDLNSHRIFNSDCCEYTTTLDVVSGELEGLHYDEYNGEYCNEVVEVSYYGRWIDCNVDRLEDFRMIGDYYYHIDDICFCEECEEYYLAENSCYSELLEEYFCSWGCAEAAEERYKEQNWEWDEIDSEYIDPSEAVEVVDAKGYTFVTKKSNISDDKNYKFNKDTYKYEYVG